MKYYLILLLYDIFFRGGEVERQVFCTEHNISERTFYRYMREIGYFLMREKKDCILEQDEVTGKYVIKRFGKHSDD